MKNILLTSLLIVMLAASVFSQDVPQTAMQVGNDPVPACKFSVCTTWLTFNNFGPEGTNVHMYEFHFNYKITPKDIIGIKIATWKLFGPMGIPFWDPLFMKESEFYPGRIRESGIGITYQRFLWKKVFASIEILPLKKTYLANNNNKIGDGFKLYTSYHVGYHVSLLNDRFFLEPQIHCNYWPIDTKGPQGFEEKEKKWSNYFLFEPNLFIGFTF